MFVCSRAVTRTLDLRRALCRSRNVLVTPLQTPTWQRVGIRYTQRRQDNSEFLIVAQAGRPPNFNNGSFDFDSLDFDDESIELAQAALPVMFGLLAFGFLYPLGGIPLPGALVVGVGATFGLALSSGYLSKIERKLGISTYQSALVIVGLVFAIFAVPAVLQFGFFLLAIGAAANIVTMLANPDGLSGRMPGGFDDSSSPFGSQAGRNPMNSNFSSRSGPGGMGSSSTRRDSGKTIDVEWETIDD